MVTTSPIKSISPVLTADLLPSFPGDWPGPGPIDLTVHDRPHASSTIEWWYVNSHLTLTDGRLCSLFASFFRMAVGRDEVTGAFRYAHSLTWALTDVGTQQYHADSRVDHKAPDIGLDIIRRGEDTTDPLLQRALQEVLLKGQVPLPDRLLTQEASVSLDELSLDYDGNRFSKQADGRYRLMLLTADKRVGADLYFHSQTPPVRHGDDGVVRGTAGEGMFYYFMPHCCVEGTVVLDDQSVAVANATGWYDHEFGKPLSDEPEGKISHDTAWNWISVQLGNGYRISAYDLFDNNRNGAGCGRWVILIDPQGKDHQYTDFTLQPLKMWTSSRTFDSYPTSWQLDIPAAKVSLYVEADLAAQEFITVISKPAFWEGRVSVRGTINHAAVAGLGYVERSGFGRIDKLDDFFRAVTKQTRKAVQALLPLTPTDEQLRRLVASDDHAHYLDGLDPAQYSRTVLKPIREMIDRGGKSWRSYAALACIDMVGGDSQQHLSWLAWPELLHTGSLTAAGGTAYLWSTTQTTPAISVSAAGTYSVTVTNGFGCVASASATVTVSPATTALISPSAVTICAGTSATLTASGGTAYLWSTTQTTPAISVSAAGTYAVTVTNGCGCVASTSTTVTLNPATVFTSQPPAQSLACIASNVSVSVTATGTGTIAYQWFKNTTGTPIPGQTAPSLSFTNVQLADAGIYFATATSDCGTTASTAFTLTFPALYVTTAGAGTRDGSAWSNAYAGTQLQQAIDQAATTSTSCATRLVWIAQGIYKPTTLTGPASRTIAFAMKNNVWIYGGFAGTEISLEQRPAINPTRPSSTTLSGEIGTADVTDNSIHVVHNRNVDNTARLDGVVVLGGNASDQAGDEAFGGGVYNNARAGGLASPRFSRVWFTKNRADLGAGLANNAFGGGTASPELTACWFTDNVAGRYGGGLYTDADNGGQAIINLRSCLFWNNSAPSGPAISSVAGSVGRANITVINGTIVNNPGPGKAVAVVPASGADNARTVLINSIVQGNVNQQFCAAGDAQQPPVVWYSNIDFTFAGASNQSINADPLFVNEATGDFRLQGGSAGINLGDPTASTAPGNGTTNVGSEDGYNQARIVGGRVDMGAFEFGGLACGGGVFVTVKAGLWNDPTTWACGVVPTSGAVVSLRHTVTIPTGYVALGRSIRYDIGGGLVYQTGARLRLGF